MRDYEPPLSEAGMILAVGKEPEIYPGVRGYAVENEGLIYIPLIIGAGEGKVSEMLSRLSSRCRVVSVVSGKLFSMLRKRGWKMQTEEVKEETVDVWEPPGSANTRTRDEVLEDRKILADLRRG